jgi:hypothetical protein
MLEFHHLFLQNNLMNALNYWKKKSHILLNNLKKPNKRTKNKLLFKFSKIKKIDKQSKLPHFKKVHSQLFEFRNIIIINIK